MLNNNSEGYLGFYEKKIKCFRLCFAWEFLFGFFLDLFAGIAIKNNLFFILWSRLNKNFVAIFEFLGYVGHAPPCVSDFLAIIFNDISTDILTIKWVLQEGFHAKQEAISVWIEVLL